MARKDEAKWIVRPAVRILLIDEDNRVLLLHYLTPDNHEFWCTPGGGVDLGEDNLIAAKRELEEELGLTEVSLSNCVWIREHKYVMDMGQGPQNWQQQEQFFLAHISNFTPRKQSLTAFEQESLKELHWFSLSELEQWNQPGQVAPRKIAFYFKKLLDEGEPLEPIDVGV